MLDDKRKADYLDKRQLQINSADLYLKAETTIHQKNLLHNFKKAFNRVWHEELWGIRRSINIDEGLVKQIPALYYTSGSVILMSGQIGQFFETTVGVSQGCLLSSVLLNLYLKRMRETLENHESSISLKGRALSNPFFCRCY